LNFMRFFFVWRIVNFAQRRLHAMIHAFVGVIRVAEAKTLELAVCMSLEADDVGGGVL